MEKKLAQTTSARSDTLQRYHSMTSPLMPLAVAEQQEATKK